ncbi:hypothetical protein ACLNGX_19495 [Bacillus velezensis]|uniref:hypothetical protein n=1 Tax=Bacillus amyloliquefaciens group TaxID=1938374 RepID=UPI0011DF1870|nr:hypothetical protein [Bacillus velezensis]MBI0441525.1 hypothetical protein [Bacillus velezensis]MCC9265305.1 hypothetical protein [Bacillus velezensis]QQY05477.1 hypothetical protein JKJ03_19110 [Bacillus velezensis]UYP22919.1 hypothetical protein OF857_19140 [Bacillus velezensis]
MGAHQNRTRLYFTVFGFSIDTLRCYEKNRLAFPAAKKRKRCAHLLSKRHRHTIFFAMLKKTGLSVEEMTEFIHARGFALAHKTPMTEEYAASVKTKVEILTKHVSKPEK